MNVKRILRKRPVGRPRSSDPKDHPPNFVMRTSLITKMLRLSNKSGKCISYHFEEAVKKYLEAENL